MIDFNHKNPTEAINAAIDRGIMFDRKIQPRRNYLGGSAIGEECERKIQFKYFNVPEDDGKEISGQSLRRFAVGHALEDLAVKWFRAGGFDLRVKKPNGDQFGFSTFKDRIRGHIDGVFVGGHEFLKYPALWECKTMAEKYFKQCKKEGVRKSHPQYYDQVQIYMAYMQLTDNPAIFTATNKNDQMMLHQAIPFDADAAQKASDKAVRILQACDAGEILPRISNDPAFFKCRWCSWADHCHNLTI